MKTIETNIFVHDQQIVLDCIASAKFNTLTDVCYVFLGMGEAHKEWKIVYQTDENNGLTIIEK